MTKYMGLIGYPLGHSVSPAMHQAAFSHYKLDMSYETWANRVIGIGNCCKSTARS